MATIVASSVKSKEMGEEALDRLEGVAEDVAVVYKSDRGKVKLEQSSDLTAGKGLLRGGLLGAAVSIFAGHWWAWRQRAVLPVAAYGALRDKGISDKVMKLAGRQLEAGQAAVFVLADEDVAEAIEGAVRESGIPEIEVASFPEEAAGVVREALKRSDRARQGCGRDISPAPRAAGKGRRTPALHRPFEGPRLPCVRSPLSMRRPSPGEFRRARRHGSAWQQRWRGWPWPPGFAFVRQRSNFIYRLGCCGSGWGGARRGTGAGAVGSSGVPALGSWMMLPHLTTPSTQTVLPMNDSLYGAAHVDAG